MTDAFLLQMDDFDRILEFKLRRMLGAVVAEALSVSRRRPSPGPLHLENPFLPLARPGPRPGLS